MELFAISFYKAMWHPSASHLSPSCAYIDSVTGGRMCHPTHPYQEIDGCGGFMDVDAPSFTMQTKQNKKLKVENAMLFYFEH